MSLHDARVLEVREVPVIVKQLHEGGKKIAFTNGCFDLLHVGHIHSLRFAKQQGDVLMVAVNDDSSVRLLKGDQRPIFPLSQRVALLAAIRWVDYVLPFSGDTALEIVSSVRPDVYVKGDDYCVEQTPEGIEVLRNGGVVRTVPRLAHMSTTDVINRIASTSS